MKVYTYYAPLPDISPDAVLFRLWAESWRRQGWEPIILSRPDAVAVSKVAVREISDSRELRRGALPRGYTTACHLRWLAHSAHGGLHVDYDVINRTFTPNDLRAVLVETGVERPVFLSGTNCPCAVYATPDHAREMVALIIAHGRAVDDMRLDAYNCGGELRYVAHDQAIFARFPAYWSYSKPPVCLDFSDTGDAWRRAQLIHFPNSKTPSPRGQFIHNLNLIK